MWQARVVRPLCAAFLYAITAVSAAQAQRQVPPQAAPPATSDRLVLDIAEPVSWSRNAPAGTRDFEAARASFIRVAGTAAHPQGVKEVRLNKNVASIVPKPDGTTEFIGYVRVEQRMTSAVVEVVTNANEVIPTVYKITPVEPPPPPPTPVANTAVWSSKTDAAKATGKRWAVIIGISQYEDPDIPSLKYADVDAKAMYEFFRSPLAGLGGFKPENMQLLINKDATYTNMKVALFDFLKQAAPEDVVYIYFAGHGAPDPGRRENLYLLPYDARAGSMGGTAFRMDDMNRALAEVTAAHKILITDACHSGGVSTAATRALGENAINEAFLSRMTAANGVQAILTASDKAQQSLEDARWKGERTPGHGVFTHYLLKGLKGSADANGDQIVDLFEMMQFTIDSVSQATARAQTPVAAPTAYDGSFPVSLVLPGVDIPAISDAEIAETNKSTTIALSLASFPWIPSVDSLVMVVGGAPETLKALLKNENRDAVPPSYLSWMSSNSAIARVDATGRVTALAGGTVQITASNEKARRDVRTLIRVLPRPSEVVFLPRESSLTLVLTEKFQVSSDLLIGSDQWIRGMAPQLMLSDSLSLRQLPGLEFEAYRAGTATLTATIAGVRKDWAVRVIPPNVKAQPIPVAMPLEDSVKLSAVRVRPDNKVLGDAPNAAWHSVDTSRAVVRDGWLVARGIGRARVVASLGNATDTVSSFVLGDLLVATTSKAGANVATIGLRGGTAYPLLPPDLAGAQPALSPKGDKIVFVSSKTKRLYVMDTDGSNVRRLTPDLKGLLGARLSSYEEHSPSWTNDGASVVFISNAHGNYEVLSVNAAGTEVQRLTSTDQRETNVVAATDGPRIAFDRAISGDDADLVIALRDGSQQQQIRHTLPFGQPRYSTIKPRFMPGGQALLYVKRWAGNAGESLHIMDINSGATTKDLLAPQKDNAILYAVSPDGQYVAYHRLAEWGSRNNSIAVIDLNGVVLRTISLDRGVEIRGLAWGASSSSPKGGGK